MSKKIALMQGASAHATEAREVDDYYATDPEALKRFLGAIDFPLNHFIWEPACGGGHLVEVLKEQGYNVMATDIVDRGSAVKTADFLTLKGDWSGDILTNPPFKHAEAFVRKALDLIWYGNRVIFFLRIMFPSHDPSCTSTCHHPCTSRNHHPWPSPFDLNGHTQTWVDTS